MGLFGVPIFLDSVDEALSFVNMLADFSLLFWSDEVDALRSLLYVFNLIAVLSEVDLQLRVVEMSLANWLSNRFELFDPGFVLAFGSCLAVFIEPFHCLIDVCHERGFGGLVEVLLEAAVAVKVVAHFVSVGFEDVSQLLHFQDIKILSHEGIFRLFKGLSLRWRQSVALSREWNLMVGLLFALLGLILLLWLSHWGLLAAFFRLFTFLFLCWSSSDWTSLYRDLFLLGPLLDKLHFVELRHVVNVVADSHRETVFFSLLLDFALADFVLSDLDRQA